MRGRGFEGQEWTIHLSAGQDVIIGGGTQRTKSNKSYHSIGSVAEAKPHLLTSNEADWMTGQSHRQTS